MRSAPRRLQGKLVEAALLGGCVARPAAGGNGRAVLPCSARVRSPGPRSAHARALGAAAALAAMAPGRAEAALTDPEPLPRPTLTWAAAQLIPSPELLIAGDGVRFGGRWQLTPALYSFNLHPRLSPFRFFVVEPVVRHAGSLETYGAATYLAGGGPGSHRWLLRAGVRAHFPLLHRGEYLSCSIGGAALLHRGQPGAAYEAGLYTLFGALGLQLAYTPSPGVRAAALTLSVRYF